MSLCLTQATMPEFYVSAPGKVILFGEHSAVYAKPAIAAALSLRTYILVKPGLTEDIVIEFPDIGLKRTWHVNQIPWDKLEQYITRNDGAPITTDELVPEVLDLLSDLLVDCTLSLHYVACRCFLYLYGHLCSRNTAGHFFCIRSTLPIGAGLGSSASTAVCLAAALSALGGHVHDPVHKVDDTLKNKDMLEANFIDSWSLMGEKCFHGNPSGIDNAVATHGGAVLYQRISGPGNSSVRTCIRNFSAFKLLLTDSKIPRSTAELVASVAKQNKKFPKVSNSILDSMEKLVIEAYQIMSKPFLDRLSLLELVNINHGLLVALGVSHSSIESIKLICNAYGVGATKLTGAGGGGCTITLLRDDVSDEELDLAKKELEINGFKTFSAILGDKGVGMLRAQDLDEEDVAVKFSASLFSDLNTRKDIELLVGASVLKEWRYW